MKPPAYNALSYKVGTWGSEPADTAMSCNDGPMYISKHLTNAFGSLVLLRLKDEYLKGVKSYMIMGRFDLYQSR